jgi:hypothetical protein
MKPAKTEKKKFNPVNEKDAVLKKEHTYDDKGNVLEVKQVKADYLPNLGIQNIRMDIRDDV